MFWTQVEFTKYINQPFSFFELGAPFQWGIVLAAGSESCLINTASPNQRRVGQHEFWTYTYKTQAFKQLPKKKIKEIGL